MKQTLYEPATVADLIRAGRKLLLAADESLLASLPPGSWIGGTIPYFMTEQGGMHTRDRIHATELPSYVTGATIKYYSESNLADVYREGEPRGFSFIMIPALSKAHAAFALNASRYQGFASLPLVGWITGVDVTDIGKVLPRVFNGHIGESHCEGTVVMHVGLPEDKVAEVDILNMFSQGGGATIEFPADGFTVTEAVIDGKRQSFARYLRSTQVDTRLPLVADYAGAMINTSFQNVDDSTGVVSFYAPVFQGTTYKIGRFEGDYVENFVLRMPHENTAKMFFSCNCILNYLYAGLEGRKTGSVTGPVTFGEIAYQLLNQTLVYLTISDL